MEGSRAPGGLQPRAGRCAPAALRPPSEREDPGHLQPSGASCAAQRPSRNFPTTCVSPQVAFFPSSLLQENDHFFEDRLRALPSAPAGPSAGTAVCFKARGPVPKGVSSWEWGLASRSPENLLMAWVIRAEWGQGRGGGPPAQWAGPEAPVRSLDRESTGVGRSRWHPAARDGNLLRVNSRKCALGGAVGSLEESWGPGLPAERKAALFMPSCGICPELNQPVAPEALAAEEGSNRGAQPEAGSSSC